MPPLLEVKNLRKYYGGNRRQVRAVDGVSLEISPGEALGLVGESGSGKTTLARCCLALTKATSGEVIFDGLPLAGLSPAHLRAKRREFQAVFQDASLSLDPNRTIGCALQEPFAAHRLGSAAERETWTRALLQEVGLDLSVLGCYPGQLSGGQQQRVAIARALALKPRLIVADEPVTALDASVAAQILNLLLEIRRRTGVALLVISHSLPVVRYLCDRIAVMYGGRIVELSEPERFFAGPLHPYSRLLVESVPGSKLRPAASAVDGTAADWSRGCAFRHRCAQAVSRCALEQPQLSGEPGGRKVACLQTRAEA